MYDVAIIGFGRVGLPLGFSLEEAGLNVAAIDLNHEALNRSISNKTMPFKEPGYDELIKTTNIKVYKPSEYPEASKYIITVGTPLDNHIETNLTAVNKVIATLFSQIDMRNKTIILRSTVAPHTTKHIKNVIELNSKYKVGENVYLAMCPERIVEGKAYEELKELPQIIGAEDDISFNKAQSVFNLFNITIHRTTYIEAELSKLFTNIYRYINFAIPNYFAYIASTFNVDVFDLFKAMNTGYKRNDGLKLPGFASGTCLRKDFGMINEYFPQTDMILQAYKINEFMPKFYVDSVEEEIQGKTIGILGYTMKKDTDDIRDSLIPKMIRYIERLVPKEVYINDPNLTENIIDEDKTFVNYSIDEVLNKSDIVFIAMNHSEYSNMDKQKLNGKIVVDIWGILGGTIVNDFR